jgi:two-component system response regulator NreC
MTGAVAEPPIRTRVGVLLAIPDFPMLRAGFRRLIDAQPEMAVVGETDPAGLSTELDRTGAAVVILECAASQGDAAFEAVACLRVSHPTARIVAMDPRRARADQLSAALRAGADGFLTREAAPDDVVAAIRSVNRGQTYVSPAIVSRMVNTYVLGHAETRPEDAYSTLTDREKEVLLLAAVGHTNREIAGKLGLPEGRIHHYRATVMEKLGLHDRVELLKYAIRHGVLGAADV